MKLRVRYNVTRLIMGKFGGKVFYPYMLFRGAREDVNDYLFRHEMEHVYQVHREGFFRFYLTYLWHAARYGYRQIPYEIEARKAAPLPLTTVERAFKDGL